MIIYVKSRADAMLLGQILSIILTATTKDGYLKPFVKYTVTGFKVCNFKFSLECRVMD